MLLTGDSEETERQWWLKHDPELVRNCTILKLPHHGSRNGTDARWLQTVRPELAVASLGKNNELWPPAFGNDQPAAAHRDCRSCAPTSSARSRSRATAERWQVVEPTLANRGHPTQADIDRVAAGGDDSSPSRTTRSRTR